MIDRRGHAGRVTLAPTVIGLVVSLGAACSSCGPPGRQRASGTPGAPLDALSPPAAEGDEAGHAIVLVSREGGAGEDRDEVVAWDEEVRLAALVEHGGRWYSDLPEAVVDGERIEDLRPLDDLDGVGAVRWYKVEAAEPSYTNSDENPCWWASIGYEEHPAGVGSVMDLDVSPVVLPGVEWDGRAVGTMRYKVEVEVGDRVVSSPGAESVTTGGLLPAVRQVRRLGGAGVEVVDVALGLANLPYIWGSAPLVAGDPDTHQAELGIGADCADLVVASWRMAGASDAPYMAALGLWERYRQSPGARTIADVVEQGIYVDGVGKPIVIGEGGASPGAAVLWKFGPGGGKGHAALLVEDRGPGGAANGVLDAADLVLHAQWQPPRLSALGDVVEDVVPVAILDPVEGP